MIGLLLCLAIVGAFFLAIFGIGYIYFACEDRKISDARSIIIGIILLFVSGVLSFVTVPYLHSEDTRITKETNTIELVALQDVETVSGVTGNIFAVGFISEELRYNYFYTTDDGGIKSDSVPAYNTTIYEFEDGDENKIPRLEAVYEMNQGVVINSYYNLYVPEGTVRTEFELNAK